MRRWGAPVAAVVAASLAAGAGLAGAAERTVLRAPFDVAARRALIGALASANPSAEPGPAGAFVCPAPPVPVRDLSLSGFYRPGSGSSEVDEAALGRYRRARAPLDRFERELGRITDSYVASRPPDPALARCALDWLERWATAEALLGTASRQGRHVRKWSLASLAWSWLKVRDAAGLDAARTAVVRRWFAALAALVKADYPAGADGPGWRRNNHVYWAALAVGLAAVVADDRGLFAWAMARGREALGHIAPDGTLPLELARRSKALHYHVFSAMALVLLAELGAANGVDLYAGEAGALHRLVRRTVSGLADPAWFERRTGHAQDWVGRLDGGKLAWMEPYYARFRTPAIAPWLARFRPLRNVRAGGNATLLFGVPELPPAR